MRAFGAPGGAFSLGRFTLEPRRQLLRDGAPVPIGGKALDLLSVLAEARGSLVTKDELMAEVWPGIVVEENAIQVHISAARKALGEEAGRLATVRGKGYRLETGAAFTDPAEPEGSTHLWRRTLVVALGAVMLAILGFATFGRATAPGASTVAVMPFSEIGPAQGLGPGLADELTTVLAANPKLKVSGRASAVALANRAADPEAVGRLLGVSYVLVGSVQTAGVRTRVQARLLDAHDGMTLWSRRFDVGRGDILDVQQRIASEVEGQLRARLDVAGPASPRRLATNGEAYSLYLQARGLAHRRTASDYYAAEALLRRALASDPNYAPAWAQLAIARRQIGLRDGSAERSKAEALSYARRALTLAPNLAEAHAAWALANDFATPDVIPHLRTAIRLDPRNAETWLWLGNVVLNRQGRFSDALTDWRRAVALDPLWSPAVMNATELAASMGHRSEAQSYVARVRRSGADPVLEARAQGRILIARGAFADAAKLALSARLRAPARQTERMDWTLASALYPLGYRVEAARLWQTAFPPFLVNPKAGDLADELRQAQADPRSFWLESGKAPRMLRMALQRGRCGEVASLYRTVFASADAFWRPMQGWNERIDLGTLAMMCLDRSGNPKDAAALRLYLQDAVARTLQDQAPTDAVARAAFFTAADGDIRQALALLKLAVDRGWAPLAPGDAADLADEPALATLRGQPAFDAIRARIRAHIASERAKLGPLPPI